MPRMVFLLLRDINPEPWQAKELGVGLKGGRHFPTATTPIQQRMYQEAIRGSIEEAYPDGFEWFADYKELECWFFFWRKLESYTQKSGRTATRRRADVTNLQKSTEDALQKVFFKNDSQIKRIHSEVVAQGPDVEPRLLVCLADFRLSYLPDGEAWWRNRNHHGKWPVIPGNCLVTEQGRETP
jgi:Holliday junction resolvase RusA-like endonuclease